MWHVSAGGVPALVLGPLAVDDSCRRLGVGAALMVRALDVARQRGHGAVILLGDAPYYARFGFSADKTGELSLPGPFERDRLLGLELREGALDGSLGHDRADWRNAGHAQGISREAGTIDRAAGSVRHTIMPAILSSTSEPARLRLRSVVTTILLAMIAVMIVRDIFVRRWGSATPPATDVSQHSR